MSGLPPNIPPALLLQILQAMQAQQGPAPGMSANPAFQPPGAVGTLPGAGGQAMPMGGGAAQLPQNILQGMQNAPIVPQQMPGGGGGGPPQQMPMGGGPAQIPPDLMQGMQGAMGGGQQMPMGGGPAQVPANLMQGMMGAGGASQPMPNMPSGGGRMPNMKKGGMVTKTGPHLLHKGERVIPAPAKKAASAKHRAATHKPPARMKPEPPRTRTHTAPKAPMRHAPSKGRKR